MKSNVCVMLIEDNPEYRDAISLALKMDPAIDLTGQFATAEFALSHLQDKENPAQPDVILLDLNLPQMSGLDALPRIAIAAPEAKIIILTQSDNQANVLRAIQQGADGYLLKSATVQQIKDGIRTVMEGGASLDWSIAHYIINQFKKGPRQLETNKPLSSREMDILTLLSEGLARKEICNRLGISRGSVATYINRIFEKIQVPNAPAAIAKAYQTGLFRPED